MSQVAAEEVSPHCVLSPQTWHGKNSVCLSYLTTGVLVCPFFCRDCSNARAWGPGCKDIICSFGKISNAGRRISGKHNTNGLWKLPQEMGIVSHGLMVISCSGRVHISEEAQWFAVTQTGNSKWEASLSA